MFGCVCVCVYQPGLICCTMFCRPYYQNVKAGRQGVSHLSIGLEFPEALVTSPLSVTQQDNCDCSNTSCIYMLYNIPLIISKGNRYYQRVTMQTLSPFLSGWNKNILSVHAAPHGGYVGDVNKFKRGTETLILSHDDIQVVMINLFLLCVHIRPKQSGRVHSSLGLFGQHHH